MENAVIPEEPQFRPFKPEDMDTCTRLAWQAWVADDEGPEEDVDPGVMEGYVRSFLARSNWNEVACDSHGVIGFLFGRITAGRGKTGVRSQLSELELIPRFLCGDYGPRLSPRILLYFFTTEFKVLVNVPRSDAEINLLIVDSAHRGKRLGTRLIDRFVASAKEAKCRMVTLYTDDQMSNWKFYEIYGFKKIATFHDELTSYFSEKDATGIVYALDLK